MPKRQKQKAEPFRGRIKGETAGTYPTPVGNSLPPISYEHITNSRIIGKRNPFTEHT